MADTSGLNQQQAIATEIPYKNLALANPGAEFVNAWAIASNVKAKQMEYEDRMQALLARNRQMEINAEMRDKMYGIRLASMEQDKGIAEQKIGLMGWGMQLKQAADDRRNQIIADRASGATGLLQAQTAMQTDQIDPESPDYVPTYNAYVLKFGGNTAAPSELDQGQRTANQVHIDAVKRRQQVIDASEKGLWQRYGSDVFGDASARDTTPLTNPELFENKPAKGTWSLAPPFHSTGAPDPNYKMIPRKDAAGNIVPYPVATKTLTDYNQKFQQLYEQKAKQPQLHDIPSLGITGVNDPPDQPLPMPANKADLVPNKIYNTPKGQLRWDGNQFFPP